MRNEKRLPKQLGLWGCLVCPLPCHGRIADRFESDIDREGGNTGSNPVRTAKAVR